jgi:predicted secreted protein
VTNWKLTGSSDGESTYDVTLEGTGELVMTTVAAPVNP